MSLATRCPACGTIFRVVQDQLKVSEGWVRCGQCHEVFHGIEALFDLDSDPAVAARRAAARAPVAPPPTRVFADQRASAPIPMPMQPPAPRPPAPPPPIAIPARPGTPAPGSRFGESGPPSQAPAPVARPGYTGFTPATRPLPPAPARPAPFVPPPSPPVVSPPVQAAPAPAPVPLPPPPAATPAVPVAPPVAPTTLSPVVTRGTIAPRFAARLAEEAARAQAAVANPQSPVVTAPVAPLPAAPAPFGGQVPQRPATAGWQAASTPTYGVVPQPVAAPEPAPPATPAVVPVAPTTPTAPLMPPVAAPEPAAPDVAAPAQAVAAPSEPEPEAPAFPAFAPTPLPPPPATAPTPSTADLPPPPSFLIARPAAAPEPAPLHIPPSLLARSAFGVPSPPPAVPTPVTPPVAAPETERLPTPLVTPIGESPSQTAAPASAAALASAFAAPPAREDTPSAPATPAALPQPPATTTPIVVRPPAVDLGGSTLPSLLAEDAADEGRAGPPTLASMLPEDAGEWPPKRNRKKADDGNATESQLVDKTKDPRFLREAKRGARWRKPWVRAVLSLVALALVSAAVGQVAWPQRDTLAARWPATLPAWQWLCDQAGCKIEPPRGIASLALDGSSLTRTDTEHVLLFSADLHNRANHEVRVPSFDVTFMDLNGEIVSRKVLTPEDLGIHQAALPAEGELHVHARLQVGTLAASGFQADLFYP